MWETALTLFLIGVGLSMDAFAVSVCSGLRMQQIDRRETLVTALFFGGFQALMPLLGWALGSTFASYVNFLAPWVSFFLLSFIGIKMIVETCKESDEEQPLANAPAGLNIKELFMLAVATSIDALAVGVTFSLDGTPIVEAIAIIGTTTFLLTIVGVLVGYRFGLRYKRKAEIAGGVILLLIGIKILGQYLLQLLGWL